MGLGGLAGCFSARSSEGTRRRAEPGWALSLASSQLSLMTPCVSAVVSFAVALSDQSRLAPGGQRFCPSLDKGC